MGRQAVTAILLLTAMLTTVVPARTSGPGSSSRSLLQAPSTILKGRALVIDQEFPGRDGQRLLALLTDLGRRVQIIFDNEDQLAGLHTGRRIVVTGEWQPAAGGSGTAAATFKAVSIEASGPAVVPGPTFSTADDAGNVTAAAAGGRPLPASSRHTAVTNKLDVLVIPMAGVTASGAACPGVVLPKVSVSKVKQYVFGRGSSSFQSVASIYNDCSHGRMRLEEDSSAVVDLVELPCEGTNSNGARWMFDSCEFGMLSAWADAAEAKLTKDGFPLKKYKYRVFMIPPGPCEFKSMGYTGCDGKPGFECRTWIGGSFWDAPNAMAHELGHNLFLGHAGAQRDTWFDPYADDSCAMGYCCGNRCFNTPHAWQLGWIRVQQLDGASLAPGQTVRIELASQSLSANSGLRIVPTWAAGIEPLFLGYRTRAGGDAQLGDTLADKVHVYSSAISSPFDSLKTSWQATLAVDGSWSDPLSRLVVRFGSASRTAATVTVCRVGGPETRATCRAGVDNDCNGRVGLRDGACFRLLRKIT